MPHFIFTRRADSKNIYVAFKNPFTGKYSTKRTTGTTNRDVAERIAYEWLYSGKFNEDRNTTHKTIIDAVKTTAFTYQETQLILEVLKQKGILSFYSMKEQASSKSFVDYLETFWDYERSPYIKERLRKAHSIHKRYIARQSGAVKNYWKAFFPTESIGEITKKKINDFIDYIGTISRLTSAKGKNSIIKAGTLPLRWAYANGIIERDVTSGLVYFSGEEGERSILTPDIALSIFSLPWPSTRSMLANLLAMCTGIRAGEIQALRLKDLGDSCIYINNSWNLADGLKPTKNKERRVAYIAFPQLQKALFDLAYSNPYSEGPDGFVFFASIPKKPIESRTWLEDLRTMCVRAGMSEQDVKKITFHGWRHFFATYMHGTVEDKLLQQTIGHKTHTMLEHYSNHKRVQDEKLFVDAQHKVFSSIVSAAHL